MEPVFWKHFPEIKKVKLQQLHRGLCQAIKLNFELKPRLVTCLRVDVSFLCSVYSVGECCLCHYFTALRVSMSFSWFYLNFRKTAPSGRSQRCMVYPGLCRTGPHTRALLILQLSGSGHKLSPYRSPGQSTCEAQSI